MRGFHLIRGSILITAVLGLQFPLRLHADEGTAFFESKIRPLLVKHCLECHGEKKTQGGLRLDHAAGWKTGGDSGPAILPGDVATSLLIQAVRYQGDAVDMPPKGKLPESAIRDLEQWVKLGAPDPRTEIANSSGKKLAPIDLEAGRKHWAYQPVTSPAVPAVNDATWAASPLDRFVQVKLDAVKLSPVADAERITLVRRLYFDLWGLPPTPAEIDEFLANDQPDAIEQLVDRLLASPKFGERWGRHWLDVARFGESLTLRGFIMKPTWRYRDYVIQAWNADLPFDQFVREQIAGDMLPTDSLADKQRKMVATTFLMLGNINLEEQDKQQLEMDVIDEQLDVISKGLLAQTLTCARCHDHKFDPIPTRDYYALAGIFKSVTALEHSNVSKMKELPLPVESVEELAFQAQEAEIHALQKRIDEMKKLVDAEKKAQIAAASAGISTAAIVAVKDLPGVIIDDLQAKRVGEWKDSKLTKHYVGEGYLHDDNTGRGEKTLTFISDPPLEGRYEVRLAYSSGDTRASHVPVTIFSADGEKEIIVNQRETPPISGHFLSLGIYRFEKTGQGFVLISNEGANGYVTADAVQFLPINDDAEVAVATSDSVKSAPVSALQGVINRPRAQDQLKRLEGEMKQLKGAVSPRPMVMTVAENRTPTNLKVHVRGSLKNLGETVPRGMMQVVSVPIAVPATGSTSGRKELADWLSTAENPLTARVFVNRTWHWLMGAGIVRTADNFGTTGELPSHPELLNHLTRQFIEQGWSPKTLVRQLVLSRTYQLNSNATGTPLAAADPENRLFGRALRRRLDAEALRDAMLQISGQLDPTCFGSNYPTNLEADYNFKQTSLRRSVYLPVFRNSLPELFEAFDFADPSVTTGVRNVSTVPQQALFLMNHPFVMQQARYAASEFRKPSPLDETAKIQHAYRLALGRPPTSREAEIARQYVTVTEAERTQAWSRFLQTLFASIDFRYVE